MPLPLKYREDKATQAAAHLLRRGGGRLPYLSLIKLLYFADRQALCDLGRPISFDLFVSMPRGPVLSRTYDLIMEEPDPDLAPSYWHQHISEPERYEVSLIGDPSNDQLSRAEEAILDEVFNRLGHLSRWRLVALAHQLPEWEDPQGSSRPIDIRDILLCQGLSEEDVEAIIEELAAAEAAKELTP